MAYGTPGDARRRRGVLHPHPPGPAARARAARRPACAATTPSAASRRWPSAPRPSAPPSPPRSTSGRRAAAGSCSARSTPRRSSRTRSPTLAGRGVDAVVGLVLAPHYSAGQRRRVPRRAWPRRSRPAAARGPRHRPLAPRAGLPRLPRRRPSPTRRPTLPEPTTRCCSPPTPCPSGSSSATRTPTSCAASAAAVAERAGLPPWAGWGLAWQSAGRTPEPWRGPDILEVIRDLGRHRPRPRACWSCPQGFTSDHLEVALRPRHRGHARVADEVGLAFARTRVVNDDPAVMGALADRVVAAARGRRP